MITHISTTSFTGLGHRLISFHKASIANVIIESLDEHYLTNNINKICLEYHLNKNGEIHTILDKLKKCGFDINFEYGDHQINDELGIIYAHK
jgi:hypothetical protein